jgi:L-malate glycosyltransferase
MSNKILFIAPSNSIHSHKWINFFKNKNYNISWISFYTAKNIDKKKIKYYDLSKNNFLKNYFLIKRLLKNENFSTVHLHYIGRFSYLLIFLKIKRLIVTPWGSDIKLLKHNSIKFLITRKILKMADLITVDANYMIEILKKISNNKKIVRINFGTDTDFFKPAPNIAKDKFKIISLRNLEKIYSLETLIKAIEILKDRFKQELIVDIYGDGSENKNLKSLVKKLSLENIINFKGKYDYDDLLKILNSYDLYVSTSTSDAGLAGSTSEAMSCGIIPLVSNNSENEFWMSENSGFLFETKSYIDLAEKILKIKLLDDKNKNVIRVNSRNKIVNYNSFKNEMNKMHNQYKLHNEKN